MAIPHGGTTVLPATADFVTISGMKPLEDKDIACFLALRLRWNQIEPSAVIAWADSIIADRTDPPDWAIDLSMPPHPKDELIAMLQNVPGIRTENVGTRVFLALLRQKWITGELTGPQVGRILYGLLQENYLPSDMSNAVYSIEDGYDLAERGYYDKPAIDERLRLFLEAYKEYEPILYNCPLRDR